MIICQPPIWPKNPHIQSFLASSRLRLRLLPKEPRFIKQAQQLIIDTELVMLEGVYSPNQGSQLVIILHGWEGSADSTYVQLLAHRLYEAGCSVLRLNMRDHGGTHHMNEALFHSCRIEEMVMALDWIVDRFEYQDISLCGFSLGGNFALRMAAYTEKKLSNVFAISPPINPHNAMLAIQNTRIYHAYFMKKWRRSLQLKQDHFPHLFEGHDWQQESSLADLTADFVVRHTDYPKAEDYFAGYRITPKIIQNIDTDAQIISSWDDPVIPFTDLSTIDRLPQVKIVGTPHGGHCGFIQGLSLHSWVEAHIVKEVCHE